MKYLFLFVFSLSSSLTFACEQAPAAAYDLEKIKDAIRSIAFDDELQRQSDENFGVRIKRISFSGREVQVKLSNQCHIFVDVTYWSDDGGMCPQVEKVTARTVCP